MINIDLVVHNHGNRPHYALLGAGSLLVLEFVSKKPQRITTSIGTSDRKFNLLSIPRAAVKTNRDPEDLKALYANARWSTEQNPDEVSMTNDGKMFATMSISV